MLYNASSASPTAFSALTLEIILYSTSCLYARAGGLSARLRFGVTLLVLVCALARYDLGALRVAVLCPSVRLALPLSRSAVLCPSVR